MMYELSLKREIGAGEANLFVILVIWDILQQSKSLLFQNSQHLKSKHVQDGCLITSVYGDGAPNF